MKKKKSNQNKHAQSPEQESVLSKLKEKIRAENEAEDSNHHENTDLKVELENNDPVEIDATKDSPKQESSLQEQLDQKTKDYLYLQADFDNFKKQTFKERQDLIKYGARHFIESFVEDVLDDLERSLTFEAKSVDEIKKGLNIIHKKLQDMMQRFGVEVLDPTGQAFDPNFHEALGQEVTSKLPPDHVVTILKKGYKLHDKVIRPAQVIVSKEEEDS